MSTRTVISQGDVHITQGGALVLDGEQQTSLARPGSFAAPTPGTDNILGRIAMWGTNNLLPQEMAADIEAVGALQAGIEAKARIGLGKGPTVAKIVGFDKSGYEIVEWPQDNEIADWLEMNRAFEYSLDTMKDLLRMGNAPAQLLLSPDRSRLWGFKRQDPCQCRMEKIDSKTRRVEHVYMSGDWSQYGTTGDVQVKDEHTDKVPLLDRSYPLLDLMNRKSGNTFMVWQQYGLTGRSYYSPSPWYAAKKWVNNAKSVPALKEAISKNQMSLKYQLNIHAKFWDLFDPTYKGATDEEKKIIKDKFYASVDECLMGDKNAGKSIWSTQVYDEMAGKMVNAVEVIVLDDKLKDGKLLLDSAAANIEILLPLMINAALLGVDMPGGGAYSGGSGSGSNIREAFLVQVMLGEAERRINNTVFAIAKKLNGWDPSYVIRYPNQILTTLNTGANTQPTA
jgi:hypothetical protein